MSSFFWPGFEKKALNALKKYLLTTNSAYRQRISRINKAKGNLRSVLDHVKENDKLMQKFHPPGKTHWSSSDKLSINQKISGRRKTKDGETFTVVDLGPLTEEQSAKAGFRPGTLANINAIDRDGRYLGSAKFRRRADGKIEAQDASAGPGQSRGVGTAMYDYAEKTLGKRIVPALEQTEGARKFWQKRLGKLNG